MKKMPNFKPIVAATAATAGVVTSAGVVGGLVYAHQAHREKISSGLKEIQREGYKTSMVRIWLRNTFGAFLMKMKGKISGKWLKNMSVKMTM